MNISLKKILFSRMSLFFALAIVIYYAVFFGLYQGSLTTEVKDVGGEYREAFIGSPRFINPVLAQSQTDKDLTRLTYSSLIEVDEDGNVEYLLAENLTTNENKDEYLLEIKEGLLFSDGTNLDAYDVLFTINKIKNPSIKSPYYNEWVGINVEVIDAQQLRFNFEESYEDFPYNLELGVLPEHLWEDVRDDEFVFNNQNIMAVGAGPFVPQNLISDETGSPMELRFEGNDYFSQEVYLSNFVALFYESQEDVLDDYQKNNVDGIFGVSPIVLNDIEKKDTHISEKNLNRYFGIFFNTENNKDVLTPATRKALSLAINRRALSEELFSGYARPVVEPTGSREYLLKDYDEQRAQALLAEEGWRKNSEGRYLKSVDGTNTPLVINLSIPEVEEINNVAQFIERSLGDFGAVVNIRRYSETDLSNEVIRARDFDALLFGYELEKASDLYAFWHSSQKNDPGLNISLYESEVADELLSKLLNGLERDEDKEAFIEEWQATMPALLLYQPELIYIHNNENDIDLGHNPEDRFNHVNTWYKNTRHVWSFLVESDSNTTSNE